MDEEPIVIDTCHVGVDRYDVAARIGVHAHEHGHTQHLIVSVAVRTAPPQHDDLSATFNYIDLVTLIEDVAGQHIDLIETFAARIARSCLGRIDNLAVEVRVEKPPALRNGMAWTSIVMSRWPSPK